MECCELPKTRGPNTAGEMVCPKHCSKCGHDRRYEDYLDFCTKCEKGMPCSRENEPKRIDQVVHPDAPTTTNERGGSQSLVDVRFDLLDAKALFAVAGVLHDGAEKYSPGNWRLIGVRDHLNHLLMHVYAYLSGDETDEHLSHAVCRAIFALGVTLDPEARPEQDQT